MSRRRSLALALALALAGALACRGSGSATDDATATDPSGDETAGACGDGVAGADEACDGTDLAGQACADLPGLHEGTLACTATCTLDTTGCTADPSAAAVRLSEIVSSPVPDGAYAGATDAVELYNTGTAPADLSGARLSDDLLLADGEAYTLPDGTILEAGARLVLVRQDDATGQGDFPFGISSDAFETLILVDVTGTTIDTTMLLGSDAVISWCRLPDGDGPWQRCRQTLGEPNAAADCGNGTRDADEACDGADLGALASCDDLAAGLDGALACTPDCTLDTSGCSVVPSTGLVLDELSSSGDDPVEILNAGDTELDLEGYVLTDELTALTGPYDPEVDLEELALPAGTVLPPGERLVVLRGTAPNEHPFGLGAGGDSVALLDPALVVVDFVRYADGEAATSYCRLPDGPDGAWTAGCTPTPGLPNR